MKKLIVLILTAMLLCGCAEGKSENSKAEPVTFDAGSYEKEEDSIDSVTSMVYDSINAFKASEFISNMKSEGYTPYYLDYDQERYTFNSIIVDGSFYNYRLYDNVEKKGLDYTISYASTYETVDDLAKSANYYDKNIITTAQRNGVTYDVYLSTSPYNFVPDNPEPVLDYWLLYIPFPEYQASIFVDGDTTTDEILSYFDDFELVAEE